MDLQKKLNDIFAEIDTVNDSIKKMKKEHETNIKTKEKKVKEDLKILRQLLTNNRFLDYSTSFFSGNSYHNGILIPLPYVYTHKATETLNQTLKTNADLQEKLKRDKELL